MRALLHARRKGFDQAGRDFRIRVDNHHGVCPVLVTANLERQLQRVSFAAIIRVSSLQHSHAGRSRNPGSAVATVVGNHDHAVLVMRPVESSQTCETSGNHGSLVMRRHDDVET